jgi:hypothetical protein
MFSEDWKVSTIGSLSNTAPHTNPMGICGLEHQRQSWLVPAQARDFDVDPRQRGVIKHGVF